MTAKNPRWKFIMKIMSCSLWAYVSIAVPFDIHSELAKALLQAIAALLAMIGWYPSVTGTTQSNASNLVGMQIEDRSSSYESK